MVHRGSLKVVAVICLGALATMAAAQAPAAGPASFDVRKYGAVADGKTKDTAAFQKALDACAAGGGGEVTVPAGDYLIGSIALKSSTTLRLAKDAKLIGSGDLDDYPLTKGRWEGQWVDAHRGLISAQDAKDIAVVGPGNIAGNPAIGGRQMPRRPCVIETINCTNVRFEDFSAQQARMWTIHPTYCENITAKHLTIRTATGNADGIDVDSCKHVRIEECDIETGDDCVAIKSGRGLEGFKLARPTEDVLISHCTLADTIFACVGIGSETSGGIRNIRIENCKFTRANTFAIYIKSRPGRGAFIEDVTGKDLDVANAKGGFLRVNLLNSGLVGPDPVPGDEGIPAAKNFSFSDVKTAECGALIEATSISPIKPLNGFSVARLSGTARKGVSLANMLNVDLQGIEATGFTGPRLEIANVTGKGLDGAAEFHAPPAPAGPPATAPAAQPTSAPRTP